MGRSNECKTNNKRRADNGRFSTPFKTDRERFMAMVDVRGLDECWPWLGGKKSKNKSSHGNFFIKGKFTVASRSAFKLFVGKISSKKNVCHHCDFPPCVNPEHLFSGTQSENMRDCVSKGRLNSHKLRVTHCPSGHPYSKDNTYRTPEGWRQCIVCKRKQWQK